MWGHALFAEESPTYDHYRLRDLYNLRNRVINAQTEGVHWDLTNYVTINKARFVETSFKNGDVCNEGGEVINHSSDLQSKIGDRPKPSVWLKVSYAVSSSVAVTEIGMSNDAPIWILIVRDSMSDNDETVCSLKVHWYGTPRQACCLFTTYYPLTNGEYAKPLRSMLWKEKTSTDAVTASFASLKKMETYRLWF